MRRLITLSLFMVLVLAATLAPAPTSRATTASPPRVVVFEAFMRST